MLTVSNQIEDARSFILHSAPYKPRLLQAKRTYQRHERQFDPMKTGAAWCNEELAPHKLQSASVCPTCSTRLAHRTFLGRAVDLDATVRTHGSLSMLAPIALATSTKPLHGPLCTALHGPRPPRRIMGPPALPIPPAPGSCCAPAWMTELHGDLGRGHLQPRTASLSWRICSFAAAMSFCMHSTANANDSSMRCTVCRARAGDGGIKGWTGETGRRGAARGRREWSQILLAEERRVCAREQARSERS